MTLPGWPVWLNASRARAYGRILAVLFSISSVVSALTIVTGSNNLARRPDGIDFVAFRSAAVMAVRGKAAQIYRHAPLESEERLEAWIGAPGYYPVMYPPPFLLFLIPLSLVSYQLGYLLFVGGGVLILALLISRYVPGRSRLDRIVPVLAFSGILVNVEAGQNGLLTAAAMASGMIWLDSRPLFGGAGLALLLCKPHLAITTPLVLFAGRRWRALLGFAVCGVALFTVSILAFGFPAWANFLAAAPMARTVIENSAENPARMASVFAAMRLLGSTLPVAYFVHAAIAIPAVAISAYVSRTRRMGGDAAAAVIASSGLLTTPYLFDYDLAILAVPLAWLLRCGVEHGFLRGERAVMIAALLLPIALRPLSIGLGVPVAPAVLIGVFAAVIRRTIGRQPTLSDA